MAAAPELAFHEAEDAALPYRARVAALTTCAANGLYALFDAVSMSGSALSFRTEVRLAFTPVYVAFAVFTSTSAGRRRPQAVVLALAAVLACELGLLGTRIPADQNLGFYTAIFAFAAFLPLTRVRTALMTLAFVAAFLGLQLALGHTPSPVVVRAAGNLLTAGIVASVAAAMAENLRRSEFDARSRLADAHGRLAELDRAKSRFFADVSHELRTPLSAALLALSGDGAEHPATRPLRRLQKLVEEVLELSRLDAGVERPVDETTELAGCLAPLCDEFAPAFAARRIAFRVEAAPARARIGAAALEKVAVNLVGNALKYTPEGGAVLVRVAVVDGRARLDVQDDGPGIAPGDLPRIFDRFVRLEQRSDAPGTGIGLALASQLAELHGGTLTCESQPGETTFRASWPEAPPEVRAVPEGRARSGRAERVGGAESASRAQDAVAAALDGVVSARRPAPEPRDPRKPLVLVIEDHAELATRIADTVREAGAEVRVAHDGEEGVALALRLVPDLVVSDLMLPKLDGAEVVRRLRAEPATRSVTILVLTALAEREHVLAGLAAGADDYLAKPVDAAMLRARVDALLRLRARHGAVDVWDSALRMLCRGFAGALGYDTVAIVAAGADGAWRPLVFGGTVEPAQSGWDGVAGVVGVSRLSGLPALAGVDAAVVAPLRGGEPAVLVGLAAGRAPSDGDLERFAMAAACASAMADRERAASALARVAEERRRLSAAVIRGEDAASRRLALELHDGAGQTLIGALLHLDLATRASGAPAPPELAMVRELVHAALTDIREVSRELHPPALQQLGLAEALRSLAASLTSDVTEIDVEVRAVPPEVSPLAALALFRIAQAGLTNTLRHAGARRATVRLAAVDGRLALELGDDGVGFSPHGIEHGVGLLGMRERALGLGGTFVVDSAVGRGTRISVTLPLEFSPLGDDGYSAISPSATSTGSTTATMASPAMKPDASGMT